MFAFWLIAILAALAIAPFAQFFLQMVLFLCYPSLDIALAICGMAFIFESIAVFLVLLLLHGAAFLFMRKRNQQAG